jgi:hypothetical protein
MSGLDQEANARPTFEHVLLTRFNVRYVEDPNAPSIGTDPDWLARRFELFERYCLPSVIAQSAQNFSWIIIYWSRLGEFLPVDGIEQRVDRLTTAMHGYVADGLLARFSTLGSDPAAAFAIMIPFIGQLVSAVPSNRRLALLGTARAGEMASVHV